ACAAVAREKTRRFVSNQGALEVSNPFLQRIRPPSHARHAYSGSPFGAPCASWRFRGAPRRSVDVTEERAPASKGLARGEKHQARLCHFPSWDCAGGKILECATLGRSYQPCRR